MSNGLKAATKLSGVAIAYVTTGVLFYRWRWSSDTWLSDSDAIVFILPAVLAFAGNAWSFRTLLGMRLSSVTKLTVTFVLALVLTFLEFCAIMLYALNKYGA